MAGQLVNGEWETINGFADKSGNFNRDKSAFRRWITPTGTPGPNGQEAVKAEKDRYHLYVSYACPWAHRALIFRRLKKLEDIITVNVVHPHMLDKGWTFNTDFDGATGDELYKCNYLYQIYQKAKADYSGKVTVPVLWDKKENTIINNESSEIIRILNTAFNELTGNEDDYYPAPMQEEINQINDTVYNHVNNGVYKCGFAEKQNAYEKNIKPLFETLDWLEEKLEKNGPYLLGNKLTEADIRLFTTLIRFDPVYYIHFKCNLKQIRDYPALNAYMIKLYNLPEIKPTVHFDHIKQHYYYSHDHINPYRIVPAGPAQNVES
jgi:putative glutathione S-transferase